MQLKHDHVDRAYDTRNKKGEADKECAECAIRNIREPAYGEIPESGGTCRFFFPVCYRRASSMLLVLERKNDIGKSSMSSPCLLQGSIQHANGARTQERHWKLVIAFSLFATG